MIMNPEFLAFRASVQTIQQFTLKYQRRLKIYLLCYDNPSLVDSAASTAICVTDELFAITLYLCFTHLEINSS